MNPYGTRWKHRLGLSRDALVVGEQQHLNVIGQSLEYPEASLGAVAVEVHDENVELERK